MSVFTYADLLLCMSTHTFMRDTLPRHRKLSPFQLKEEPKVLIGTSGSASIFSRTNFSRLAVAHRKKG